MDWSTIAAAISFYFMGTIGLMVTLASDDRKSGPGVVAGLCMVGGAVFGLIITNLSLITF